MALPKFLQNLINKFFPNPMAPANALLESGTKKLLQVTEAVEKVVKDVSSAIIAVSKPEEIKGLVPSGEQTAEAVFKILLTDPEKGKDLITKNLDLEVNGVQLRKTLSGALKVFLGLDEKIVGGVSDIASGLQSVAEAIAASAQDPVKAASVAARAKATKESLDKAKESSESLGKQVKSWLGMARGLVG